MGVLGKDFEWKDVTKVVAIELLDKEDYFEVACVYGENEDFDVVCSFPLSIPSQIHREKINNYLRSYLRGRDLPVHTCKISHDTEKMSREEAFNMILNANEPWEYERG